MSKFKQFADQIKKQFDNIQQHGILFKSTITGDELWNIYLNSFKPGDNPVFRDPNSSEHNCNLDNNFIRRYGNVVAIDADFNIVTMWDIELPEDSIYYSSVKGMKEALKLAHIKDIFFETFSDLSSLPYEKTNKKQDVYRLGFESNHKIYTQGEADKFGVVNPGEVYQFHHFYGDLDKKFVDFSGKSQASIIGDYRDDKEVFKRGIVEIPLDTLKLVRDLINQESLLDGKTHLFKIEALIPFKTEYDSRNWSSIQTDNWFWIKSYKLPFAKFRGELIGTLCVDLAEGKELNEACLSWNKKADPSNYMKAKAPITASQIKQAQEFVEENGYSESFNRRFASLDDINVDEILHSNVGDGKIKTASVFDSVKPTASTRHKKSQFDGIEEVTIEKFMKDILPTCTSIEAFVENRMEGNLVALTTANDPSSKKMFKWNNNFSWTFKGNLAGKSQIKDAVKDRGGNVNADVAIRLHFPDTTSDYDLHVTEPNQHLIYYGNRRHVQPSSGCLDLDAQGCDGHFPPEKRVENVTYTDKSKMPKGNYSISVNNYPGNALTIPFYMEIEIEDQITKLKLKDKGLRKPIAATFDWDGNKFNLKVGPNMEILDSETISKDIWNVTTNEFHKVNLVCLSPNHWGDNNVGNKHYLFMLDKCKADESIRSFHNENLNADLVQHRKVMEVLANTTMLEPAEKQLSGLGFNATVRDEVILKLGGTFKRTIKVKF